LVDFYTEKSVQSLYFAGQPDDLREMRGILRHVRAGTPRGTQAGRDAILKKIPTPFFCDYYQNMVQKENCNYSNSEIDIADDCVVT